MKRAAALLLVLGGCGRQSAAVPTDTPGARLEAAATQAGLIIDPAKASIRGAWARDTDRVCIVPGYAGTTDRIGVSIDYGEGQSCAGSGTVTRSSDRLQVAFGDCRFTARFEGERIVFPADMPEPCEALCTGRASLAALAVDRQSESVSEALTLRGSGGTTLCATD